MKDNSWISILDANKLMRSPEEVTAFENALAEFAKHPESEHLPALHLILDDRCQQPEVMFSLIHFLESFEMEQQLQAFISVIPQLIIFASDWTRILHSRILNDEVACRLYRNLLHSINTHSPHFIRQLLEESATYQLTHQDSPIELAGQVHYR